MPRPRDARSDRRARTPDTEGARSRAPSRRGSSGDSRRRAPDRSGPRTSPLAGLGIHSRPHVGGPPWRSSAVSGRSTSIAQSALGASADAPETSTRVPRTSSMQTSAVTDAGSGLTVPSTSTSTSSSSPFVRTATMRPSSSRLNHRAPSTQSGPPVSASAGATEWRSRSADRCSRHRFQRPVASSAYSRSSSSIQTGCRGALSSPATVVHSTTMPSSRRPTRSCDRSQGMSG